MEQFYIINTEGLARARVCSNLTRVLGVDHFFDVYQLSQKAKGEVFDSDTFYNSCKAELNNLLPLTNRIKFDYQRILFDFEKQTDKWKNEIGEEESEVLRFLFAVFRKDIDPYVQFIVFLKIFLNIDDHLIVNLFKLNKASIDTVIYQFSNGLKKRKYPFTIPMAKSLNDRLKFMISQLNFLFQFIGEAKGITKEKKVEVLTGVIGVYEIIREEERCNIPLVHSVLAYSLFEFAQNQSRFDKDGSVCHFPFQDRSLWNKEIMDWGWSYLAGISEVEGEITNYRLESLMLGLLMNTPSFREVKWKEVHKVSKFLKEFSTSINTDLIHAFTTGLIFGPQEGIDEILDIEGLNDLKDYILLPYFLGELYHIKGDKETANSFFEECFSLSKSWKEKKFITKNILKSV